MKESIANLSNLYSFPLKLQTGTRGECLIDRQFQFDRQASIRLTFLPARTRQFGIAMTVDIKDVSADIELGDDESTGVAGIREQTSIGTREGGDGSQQEITEVHSYH